MGGTHEKAPVKVWLFLVFLSKHIDGSGYPDGLKGNTIPLEARIVAVVDAYDALLSGRPYRKATDNRNAIKELRKFSVRTLTQRSLKYLPQKDVVL